MKKITPIIIVLCLIITAIFATSCTHTPPEVPSNTDAAQVGEVSNGTVTVYVAANGDNAAANGSKEKPYGTITAARDAVRTLDKTQYSGITIFVGAGEYQITEPIVLTAEDSGSEACPITYLGEDGATIVGGIKFTAADFTKAEGGLTEYFDESIRDKMVMIDLNPYGITAEMIQGYMNGKRYNRDAPMFSLNGTRQLLAQYPNDYLHVGKTVTHSADGTTNTAIDWQTVQTVDYGDEHAEFVQSWSEVLPIFVKARLFKLWCPDDSIVVKRHTDSSKIDILFGGGHEPEEGTILCFYNVPEAIDIPGEYIYDTNAILYYYPTDEFETGLFTIPVAEMLLKSENTDYITFKNLIFTASNGNGVELQGRHITVEDCTISSIKDEGLNVVGDGLTIHNNTLYDLGSVAMDIKAGDAATASGDHTYITENEAYNYTVTDPYGNAVTARGANITIAHNEFHDANTCGIYVPNSVNVVIEYNELWNLSQLCDDMGMISVGGYQNANIHVRYNYIHDIFPGGEAGRILEVNPNYNYYGTYAIYYDNGSSYIETYGNIVQNVDSGFLSNGGRGNITHNNLFVNCQMWYIIYSQIEYRPDENGLINYSTEFDDYVYSDLWKELNPELATLKTTGIGAEAGDPLVWCAPVGNKCYDNIIVFNKSERKVTNWGLRPYNVEKYVTMFCGDDVKEETVVGVETYNSLRQTVDINELVEKHSEALGITLEQFHSIGKTK